MRQKIRWTIAAILLLATHGCVHPVLASVISQIPQ